MTAQIQPASYGAAILAAVVGGFAAHEAAHWLVGRALGLDMVMTMNSATTAPGHAASPDQHFWISLAGPAFTIVQALIAAALAARGAVLAYPFVFGAFLMRLTATFVSLFNPNDEMRVSVALGLGAWTLPLVVTGALLALTVAVSLRLRIGWKTNLVTYLVSTALITAIVFGDRLLR